jgi:hypothetical protein
MVFSTSTHPHKPALHFNGNNIPYTSSFPYLGIVFDEKEVVKHAWVRNIEKGAQASHSVSRQTNTMEIHKPYLRNNIFNTMALPLLTYGCAVWGPQALVAKSNTSAGAKLDKILTDFLKRSLGLGMTTPHLPLKQETQYTRPSSRILQQILTFRETILNRPDNDLVRLALIENIEMADTNVSTCWSARLRRVYSRDTSSLPYTPPPPFFYLDPDLALREREDKLDAALKGEAAHIGLKYPDHSIQLLPDDARKGLKILKYDKWCKPINPDPDPKTQLRASYLHCLHSKQLIQNVARLRLFNLPIRSECGRLDNLKRSQRTCLACKTDSVEDEYHLLITCSIYNDIRGHPQFSDLRTYWDLPDPATTHPDAIINHRFNPPGHLWHPFATLLTRCLHQRRKVLNPPPPLTT